VTDAPVLPAPEPIAAAAGLPACGAPDRPDHDRHVLLDGAFNVRDLGGLVADDGRQVRPGALYRADGMQRVGPADVAALRALGLRTVLDLRTDDELATYGAFPGDRGVVHHHLPVLKQTWDVRGLDPKTDGGEAVDFLVARYVEMLDEGAEALASALRVIADPANRAVLFHCAAGKDRTGVLAVIVLSLLGLSDEDVADDYHLTQHGTARWLAWAVEADPALLEAMTDQPVEYLASPREAPLRLLEVLRHDHGSVEGYAAHIGVGDEAVAHLRATLLV